MKTLWFAALIGLLAVIGPAQAQSKIMPLGDSITYGTRSSDGSGYRKPLYEMLTAGGLKIQMVGSQSAGNFPQPDNEGRPSWTIDDLSPRVTGWLSTYRPDIVLLMIGTNDVFHQLPAIPGRLSALIDQIVTTLPDAKVIVASVTPTFEPRDAVYNSAIPGIVRQKQAQGKHVTFCDQYHCGMTIEDTPDAIHPNDAGYRKMAEAWYPAVRALFAAPGPPSAPLHLRAAAGPEQSLLTWDTAYDAAGYTVERAAKPGGPYKTVANNISDLWYTDTGLQNGKTYYYAVSATNSRGRGPRSNPASAVPGANAEIAINCGGSAAGRFTDDRDVTGGYVGLWGYYDTMQLGGTQDPGPQNVYKTERLGNAAYTISGLHSGQSYRVRLHFCEYEQKEAGQRVFNVDINGQRVLPRFDILAAAGGPFKAVVKEFSVRPDSRGRIVIRLTSVTGDAGIGGIEVLPPASLPPQGR